MSVRSAVSVVETSRVKVNIVVEEDDKTDEGAFGFKNCVLIGGDYTSGRALSLPRSSSFLVLGQQEYPMSAVTREKSDLLSNFFD